MTSSDLQREHQSFELTRDNRQLYLLIKRSFDLIVCLLSLPFLLVIMAAIAVAITLDSPGSPIFVQVRVGRDCRPFRLYKFRTLRPDHDDQWDRVFMQAFVSGDTIGPGDKDGLKGKEAINKPVRKSDLTRVGRLLRKSSLDELPQVFNVLRGEMSLIGPRPNVPWEVEKYEEKHYERLEVLPGITGLAQVHGRSNITFKEIVEYDIQYARKLGLRLDLWIMWRTIWMVFTGKGAG